MVGSRFCEINQCTAYQTSLASGEHRKAAEGAAGWGESAGLCLLPRTTLHAKMQHRFDSNYTCGLPTPTTLRHTFGISQRGFGKFVMSAGKNHLQCPRVAATTTAARALAHLPHCP